MIKKLTISNFVGDEKINNAFNKLNEVIDFVNKLAEAEQPLVKNQQLPIKCLGCKNNELEEGE